MHAAIATQMDGIVTSWTGFSLWGADFGGGSSCGVPNTPLLHSWYAQGVQFLGRPPLIWAVLASAPPREGGVYAYFMVPPCASQRLRCSPVLKELLLGGPVWRF